MIGSPGLASLRGSDAGSTVMSDQGARGVVDVVLDLSHLDGNCH